MELTGSHTFAAPFDEVWAMLADPDAHVAKYTRMGHHDIEVLDAGHDDDTLRVVVRRRVEVDLPGFAKKVMSPSNTVTTTDEWRKQSAVEAVGTQQVDTAGAPVKVSAQTRLVGHGDATDYEVTITVDVKVPLIGGRLAKFAGGTVREQLDEDFAAGDDWLAGD